LAPDLREGHIATTIDEAKQLINDLDETKNQAVIEAAIDILKNRLEVRKEELSVIGFSVGAGWFLVAAEEYPQNCFVLRQLQRTPALEHQSGDPWTFCRNG